MEYSMWFSKSIIVSSMPVHIAKSLRMMCMPFKGLLRQNTVIVYIHPLFCGQDFKFELYLWNAISLTDRMMSLYTNNLQSPLKPAVHEEFMGFNTVMGLHKYPEENVFSWYFICKYCMHWQHPLQLNAHNTVAHSLTHTNTDLSIIFFFFLN